MRIFFVLLGHFLVMVARLLRPDGIRALVANSLLMKHHKAYYNHQRVHTSSDGKTPSQVSDETIISYYANFK